MNRLAIASNINERLRRFGMTQKRLSEELDVTEVTVSRWCSGQRIPSVYAILRMSHIFRCTMEDLCYGILEENNDT